MKTIIYVAVSVNGQILLADADNYQTPVEVLQDCISLIHQTGNMVIGLKTYNLFFSNPNAKAAFDGIEIAVLSSSKQPDIEGVTFLKNIKDVMDFYKSKGHTKIFVAGGANTYQSFINEGHVDELYVNYLPVLTSGGAALMTNVALNKTFTLAAHKLISKDIYQLHYKTDL